MKSKGKGFIYHLDRERENPSCKKHEQRKWKGRERDESERAGAEPKSQATDSRHVHRGCQWIGLVGDFGIRGTGYKGRRWGPHRCFRFYPTRPHLVPLGGSPRKHPSPSLEFIHEDIIFFFIIHGSTDPVLVFVKVGRRSGNPDGRCDHSHLNYCERVEK